MVARYNGWKRIDCILSQRPDVIHSLHADKKDTAWVECSSRVGAELRLRSSTASVVYLPSILEAGVKVLIFAGSEDLICNYKGQEEMIQGMTWSGVEGWGVSVTSACPK